MKKTVLLDVDECVVSITNDWENWYLEETGHEIDFKKPWKRKQQNESKQQVVFVKKFFPSTGVKIKQDNKNQCIQQTDTFQCVKRKTKNFNK